MYNPLAEAWKAIFPPRKPKTPPDPIHERIKQDLQEARNDLLTVEDKLEYYEAMAPRQRKLVRRLEEELIKVEQRIHKVSSIQKAA